MDGECWVVFHHWTNRDGSISRVSLAGVVAAFTSENIAHWFVKQQETWRSDRHRKSVMRATTAQAGFLLAFGSQRGRDWIAFCKEIGVEVPA